MKKTYLITMQVTVEVEAASEAEAIILARENIDEAEIDRIVCIGYEDE